MTARLFLLAPLLAACTIPVEDVCFAQSTRELATVYTLIAQAEEAAARGYRRVDETWVDLDVSDCYATLSPRSICTTQYETRRGRAVAVDVAQEERIAADLRARVPDLKARARSDYASCLARAAP